jgi:hypothetical protein
MCRPRAWWGKSAVFRIYCALTFDGKWCYTPLQHDFALDPIIPPFDFHFRIYTRDLAILSEWWQQRIAWWELLNAACQIICMRKQQHTWYKVYSTARFSHRPYHFAMSVYFSTICHVTSRKLRLPQCIMGDDLYIWSGRQRNLGLNWGQQ